MHALLPGVAVVDHIVEHSSVREALIEVAEEVQASTLPLGFHGNWIEP